MAKRKGWDNLTDDYRERLVRKGFTEALYDAGIPLHGARGKTAAREAFEKQAQRFARAEVNKRTNRSGNNPMPDRTEKSIRDRIRHMGMSKGQAHMAEVRRMTRLYESGDVDLAHAWWLQRDKSLPDYMYFYHGMFGF